MAETEATVCGPITGETFARFLRCELEAYLQTRKVIGGDCEFPNWRRRSHDRYKQAALAALRSRYSDEEIHVGMPTAAALKQRQWQLITDGLVETPTLRTCIDVAELARSPKNGSLSYYRPIRFVPTDIVGKPDKLLLAFDALALSRVTGVVPPTGRFVHGSRNTRTTVSLAQSIREVRLVIARIAALRARTAPPQPVLNKHCADCEFRSRCRADAVERDDLSLLAGLYRVQFENHGPAGARPIVDLRARLVSRT